MRAIWKYSLGTDFTTLMVPTEAKLLCMQLQQNTPCLWFEVDTQAPEEPRYFYIVGTGVSLPRKAGTYVGTFQQPPMVWHVYEGIA